MMNGSYFIDNLSIYRAWIRLFFCPKSGHTDALVREYICDGLSRYLRWPSQILAFVLLHETLPFERSEEPFRHRLVVFFGIA